jgi:hypothetical protein
MAAAVSNNKIKVKADDCGQKQFVARSILNIRYIINTIGEIP